jgi:hypothetical protein
LKNKKLTGLDDVSPYLRKKCVPYVLKPVLELSIASMKEGIFPSTLKRSVVKPIYKKIMKKEANSYRPITLVPALSESLEKVIYKRANFF